jgi:hypothetical protein
MTIDERGNGTTKYMLPVLSSIGGLLIGERADAAPALNLVAPREQWFSPPKEYCAKRSRCRLSCYCSAASPAVVMERARLRWARDTRNRA